MDEIKRYIEKNLIIDDILGIVLFSLLIAANLFFAFNTGNAKFLIYGFLALLLFVLLAVNSIKKHRRFSQMLNKAASSPMLQEELAQDFRHAEAILNGGVLIGEKYFYIKGSEMIPRSERAHFFYKDSNDLRHPGWNVYLKSDSRQIFIIKMHSKQKACDLVDSANSKLGRSSKGE